MNKCEAKGCGKIISWGTAWYSMEAFGGKELCFQHQQEERFRINPKSRETALFVNKMIRKNRRFHA